MDKQEKIYIGKIKSVDEENFVVEAVVSDETIDRYGEVIAVDAYKKRLGNYKSHAVLLSSHKYTGLKNQIGMAQDIRVKDGALVAKFKYFVNDGNEEADWAWKLASKYNMAAYSVGFLPFEWEDNDWDDKDVRSKKKPNRKYTDVELLEVSHVLVPANPSALQKSIDESGEEVDEITKGILMEYAKAVYDRLAAEEAEEVVEEVKEVEEEVIVEETVEVKTEPEPTIKEEEVEMKEVLEAIAGVKDFISERFGQIELRLDAIEKKEVVQEDLELDTEIIEKTDDNIVHEKSAEEIATIKEILAKAQERLNSVLSVQSEDD